MQLLTELFVGMGLNGESFANGEHLEEERQVIGFELVANSSTEQFIWLRFDDVAERFVVGVKDSGR